MFELNSGSTVQGRVATDLRWSGQI